MPAEQARLIAFEEAERHRRLRDIEDAYAPLLIPLPMYRTESFAELDVGTIPSWKDDPTPDHPFFGPLLGLEGDKAKLRTATSAAKKDYAARVKALRREVKELEKLQQERDERGAEFQELFDREIVEIRAAGADLGSAPTLRKPPTSRWR